MRSDWAIQEANRNKAGEAWDILTTIAQELKVGYPVNAETIKKLDQATSLIYQVKRENQVNDPRLLK